MTPIVGQVGGGPTAAARGPSSSNAVNVFDFANGIAATTGASAAQPSQRTWAHQQSKRQGREEDAAIRRLQQRSATAEGKSQRRAAPTASDGHTSKAAAPESRGFRRQPLDALSADDVLPPLPSGGPLAEEAVASTTTARASDTMPPGGASTEASGARHDADASRSVDAELAEIGGMLHLTRNVDWTRTDVNIFERTTVLPKLLARYVPRSVSHSSLLATQFRYRAIEEEFLRFEYRTQRYMLTLVAAISVASATFTLATQSSSTGPLVLSVLNIVASIICIAVELSVVLAVPRETQRVADALSQAKIAELNQVFFYGVISALLSFGTYLYMERCPSSIEKFGLTDDNNLIRQVCFESLDPRPFVPVAVATLQGRPRMRFFLPMLFVDLALVYVGRQLAPVDAATSIAPKAAGLVLAFATSFVCHRLRECDKRRSFVEYAIYQSRIELSASRSRALRDFVDNMLPPVMRNRLLGFRTMLDVSECGSCVVVDVANFSQFTFSLLPQDAATLIATLAAFCSEQSVVAGIDRVRSVGDRFIAVSNLMSIAEDHASRCARFGLLLYTAVSYSPTFVGRGLGLRCAIHSGQLLGGVVGETHIRYDLYGAAYVIASSIIASCPPNMIICTQEAWHLFAITGDIVSEPAKALAAANAIVSVSVSCNTTGTVHFIHYVLGMNVAAQQRQQQQVLQQVTTPPVAPQPETDTTSAYSMPDEENLVEVGSCFVASATEESHMGPPRQRSANFGGLSTDLDASCMLSKRIEPEKAVGVTMPQAHSEPQSVTDTTSGNLSKGVVAHVPPVQLSEPLVPPANPMVGAEATAAGLDTADEERAQAASAWVLDDGVRKPSTGSSARERHEASWLSVGGEQEQRLAATEARGPDIAGSGAAFTEEELALLTARRIVSQMVVDDYSTATSLRRQKEEMELEGPLRFRSHRQEKAFLRHRRDADLAHVAVYGLTHSVVAAFFAIIAAVDSSARGDSKVITGLTVLPALAAASAMVALTMQREAKQRQLRRQKIVEWELLGSPESGSCCVPPDSIAHPSLGAPCSSRDQMAAFVDAAHLDAENRGRVLAALVAYHASQWLLPYGAMLLRPSIAANDVMYVFLVLMLTSYAVLPFRHATVHFALVAIWCAGTTFIHGGVVQSYQLLSMPLLTIATAFKEHQREAAQRLSFHDVALTRQAVATIANEEKVRACVLQAMIPPPVQKRAAANRFSGQFVTWALSDLVVMSIRFDNLESALFAATKEQSAELLVQLIQGSTGQAEATIRSVCKTLAVVSLFGDSFLLAGPLIDGNEVDVQASACEAALLLDALCDPEASSKVRRSHSFQAASSHESINSYGSTMREHMGPDGSFSTKPSSLKAAKVPFGDAELELCEQSTATAGVPRMTSLAVFRDLDHVSRGSSGSPTAQGGPLRNVSPLLDAAISPSSGCLAAASGKHPTRAFTAVAAIGHATCVLTSSEYPTFDVFGIALSMCRAMCFACPFVGGMFATEKLVQMANRDLTHLSAARGLLASSSDRSPADSLRTEPTTGATPLHNVRLEYLQDLIQQMRRRGIQFGVAESWSIRGFGQLRVCGVTPASLQRPLRSVAGATGGSGRSSTTQEPTHFGAEAGSSSSHATPLTASATPAKYKVIDAFSLPPADAPPLAFEAA